MREVIFTHVEAFNLERIKSELDEIRDAFGNYLDSYPIKTSRSKHGLMGPIGKVLQKLKGERWDTPSLTGYALNIHMSNPKSTSISDEARNYLETGIDKLLNLLSTVPVTAQEKVLERIDYGLYYQRRKKGIMAREERRLKLVEFLIDKYVTPERLSESWGEDIEKIGKNFEKIWLPKKKDFEKFKGQKKIDFSEFMEKENIKGYSLEIEEDEE